MPSGNSFKCHEEVLYLQPMIPPKRVDVFSLLAGGCSEGLDAFRFFFKHHPEGKNVHKTLGKTASPNKQKGEKKKHVWLSGRLHIEGRGNEGPRLQRKRKDENEANSTTMSDNLEWRRRYVCCLKKNLNASRPSVNNIPHRGKNVKTLSRWDQRLQRQNLSWHLNGFPDGSNIGSTV